MNTPEDAFNVPKLTFLVKMRLALSTSAAVMVNVISESWVMLWLVIFAMMGASLTSVTLTKMVVLLIPLFVSVAISVKLVKPKKFLSAETLRMLLVMTTDRFLVFAAVKVMLLGISSRSATVVERLVLLLNSSSAKLMLN